MSGSVTPVIQTGVPANLLVPGLHLTVDNSKANTGTVPQRALLIGQVGPGSSLVPGQPVISTSPQLDAAAAGQGSMLALMSYEYRQVDAFTEVWLLPLADDPASQAATGAVTFTGAATAAGTLPFYVTGRSIPVAVPLGMTAANLALAVVAAVNAIPTLPVTAAVAAPGSGTVQLTAKNKGLVGNDIDLRFAYLGAAGGEAVPAGIAYTITPFAGGTQNPNATALSTALSALASQPFDFIAFPYTDTASLNAMQAFLADQNGRWSYLQQIYGHAYCAFRGTMAQRTTFLTGRNDQHMSCLPFYDSPSAVWAWAAYFAAVDAISAQQDPALPVTGFPIPAKAPPVASQDTISMRNTLLVDGGSTFTVDPSGQVVIERVVTTYTVNPATGVPDNSYRDVETMFTLTAVMRDFRIQIASQFVRCKLVADGTNIAGGSRMVTSQTIKAAFVARYRTQCNAFGWCQDPDGFAKAVQAQNAGGGRVNVLLPIRVANQLRVVACTVQFTKP